MRMYVPALVLLAAACGQKDAPSRSADTTAAAAPVAVANTSSDPRSSIFTSKGCPQCHTISGFGIKSPTEVGPDLTFAYEDVKNRFSMPLEQFLHNPTGTMQIVLSTQIQLSSAERDSVIHILKEIYEESQEHSSSDSH